MNASLTFDNKHQANPIYLDQDLVLVGSGSNADVVVEDSNLSLLHCAIVHTCDGWKVVDLYSRQGTRVNDRSVTDHILQPGDRIRLGKISATFEMTEDEPPMVEGEVKLDDGCGEWKPLESGSALIGSWGGCDIVADGADPVHVIVVHSQRGARVRAVGETGVVIINGRKTSGCALQDGDVLKVGKEQFTVRAPHLLRRSNFEPVRGVRADSPGPKSDAIIEESNRIVQLLKPIGQVPDEIRQLREDFGQQIRSLTEGVQSITEAVEDRDRKVNDFAKEHTSLIQSFGCNLTKHGDQIRELMDRLGGVVDAAESSKDATESAVGKLGQAREWLATELDSRDRALQKVWVGLVQIRKTLAAPSPDSSIVGVDSELREQIATLSAQLAEARAQLPQQLADAIQGTGLGKIRTHWLN